MDLVLSEEQLLVREEAQRLFAEQAPADRVRRTVEAGMGFDAALWQSIAGELGWCAMAIPEAYGGIGLGVTELVLLLEAAGERLAPIPLWSTACVAAPLLLAVGSEAAKAALLPRIAAGEIAASVGWSRLGAVEPLADVAVTATPVADGYVLDGHVPQVVDADAAALLLVPARLDDGLALFALEPGAGHIVRPLATLDATRQVGAVDLPQVHVPAAARIDAGTLSPETAAEALAIANLGLAAEQVGAARGVMDLTLAYIAERVQFGRTIASFQAVKHRCARLEVDFAEARALLYGAAAGFAEADVETQALDAAGARALASDLLRRAAGESIQLHGGVGFTWEYDPHLYFKRAEASAHWLGAPAAQLERVAASVLRTGAAA